MQVEGGPGRQLTTGGATHPQAYLGAGQKERTASGGTTFASSPTGLARTNNNGSVADYTHDPGGTLVAMRLNGASYYARGSAGLSRTPRAGWCRPRQPLSRA